MTGRGQVGELVARLTEARGCDEARDALRRTLGDPSLDLGFRQQETGRYTNAEGLEVELPGPGEDRGSVFVELEGEAQPVAVIVYDELLMNDQQLIDAVASASALAIEKHQLDAELRANLEELRELAHGIHPAILSDRGLGPALSALAARAPFEVKIYGVPAARLPERIESAAYFFVSEALTNAAKHADASRVTVSIAEEGGRVTIEVEDDGIGGADPARGSGLRGLVDRVSALGGRLEITSPPGRGTALRATIPCGLKGEVDYGGGAPAGLTTPRQPS